MCAATTDVTQNANRTNQGRGSITDADVAAVLRPFVRATRPLLGALSDADPFGLQARARLTALRAHATQVAMWEGAEVAFAMSNGVAQPLLDVEEFALLAGEPDGPDAVDLFAGVA